MCCYLHCTITICLLIADVLSGPQPLSGVPVEVSCTAPNNFAPGKHKIALSAAFTGSNGCPSGTLVGEAMVVVDEPVTPTPAIMLSPFPANPPPACRAAQSEQPVNITAVFAYAVTPAGSGALSFSATVVSSTSTSSCSATTPAAGEGRYIFS